MNRSGLINFISEKLVVLSETALEKLVSIIGDESKVMRPGVACVAIITSSGGSILLGKRKGGGEPGTWGPPGGHLEYGENYFDCLSREVKEETGLEIKKIAFLTATNDFMPKENRHYVTLFFEVDVREGKAEVKEPDKCDEWRFFEWHSLPENISTCTKHYAEKRRSYGF